jgi:hypothetical protein
MPVSILVVVSGELIKHLSARVVCKKRDRRGSGAAPLPPEKLSAEQLARASPVERCF